MIISNLPWPPSVNHYWQRNRNGSVRVGDAGVDYRIEMVMLCKSYPLVPGRVALRIWAYPPDKRKRDLDNILKAMLDAITHAHLIDDDSCIDLIEIKRECVVKGGRITISLDAL